jgi:uncharacterized GH25 family protein
MKRYMVSLLVFILAASAVRSHFIWVVPEPSGKTVKVIFSDSLQPDSAELLAKIGKTEAFLRGGDGKPKLVKLTNAKEAYLATIPEPQGKQEPLVTAVCTYGVVQKGNTDPFLLKYNASAAVRPGAGHFPYGYAEPWDRLELEIRYVMNNGDFPVFEVLWKGKHLVDAEVVYLAPGEEKARTAKTDKGGTVNFGGQDHKPGLHSVRARHVESSAGEHDGKKYKEVRHYSTLVMQINERKAAGDDKPKEDPAASKLLADARAARAKWDNFPGFTADVEVNFDGKLSKGKANVDSAGRVTLTGIDKEMEKWARRNLASTVGHRLEDSAARNTPCAFLDDNANHPLGRAIRVLNDELHSSYRIRDRQIMEVNRTMKDGRFSISVLENRPTAEGKFLSVAFVVNFWNTETGELQRTEAHHQTWTRQGKFDLPLRTTVVTGTRELSGGNARPAQSLTLSNHKLVEGLGK